MKVALIINIPTPYRTPVYNRVAKRFGNKFCVFYCASREPNRLWKIEESDLKHQYYFLKQKIITVGNTYVHINLDIWKHLIFFKPDIIVAVGFNPTMLLGWIYSRIYKKRYIPMSDGSLNSEACLSRIHFLVRSFIYKHSNAFIAATKHTVILFEHYGVHRSKIFLCPMCINNDMFEKFKNIKKEYDVMFSGQFINRKMPFFFIEVAKKLNAHKKDLRVLLIGSGPLENSLRQELNKNNINYNLAGFIDQENLPLYYGSSKLLLFPTEYDNWGIVANEAFAVGTPVITCDNAGAANDLIINGINGFVLPLNSDLWVKTILKLLTDENLYNKISEEAIKKVKEYNFDIAANGFINACINMQ